MTDAEITWLISNDESDPLQWVAELTRRPSWHSHAACRGMEPATFIPARGANGALVARARAVCATCTVTVDCLTYAMESPDTTGVWGGTSAQKRRAMRSGRVAWARVRSVSDRLATRSPANEYNALTCSATGGARKNRTSDLSIIRSIRVVPACPVESRVVLFSLVKWGVGPRP